MNLMNANDEWTLVNFFVNLQCQKIPKAIPMSFENHLFHNLKHQKKQFLKTISNFFRKNQKPHSAEKTQKGDPLRSQNFFQAETF